MDSGCSWRVQLMSPWVLAAVIVAATFPSFGCADTTGEVFNVLVDGAPGQNGPDADSAVDGGAACFIDGACPKPQPGEISVCGRAIDLETSAGSANAAQTRLLVRVFDPLNILDGGALATVVPDDCGWFSVTGLTAPVAGVVAVVTDDEEITADQYRAVGTVVAAAPGQIVRANGFVLRSDVNQRWSSQANLGLISFATTGSFVGVFVDILAEPVGPFQGEPVAGVTMTLDGATNSSDDYYFASGEPLVRDTIAPGQMFTTANGTGIMHGPRLANYGGAKAGCSFTAFQGLALPVLVQVQEIFGTCGQ
jgi:hypothetical protein